MPSNHSAPAVFARLVQTGTGAPAAAHLDWQACETRADGTWSGELARIPAGGLYRLETQLRADRPAGLGGPYCAEWAMRGDARDFLGVGDLWVIAGQSNAAGYGKAPVQDPPELGLHMFRASGEWALATHPLADLGAVG
jgi:hypothetical protein